VKGWWRSAGMECGGGTGARAAGAMGGGACYVWSWEAGRREEDKDLRACLIGLGPLVNGPLQVGFLPIIH
jgi:hypothetical protein